MHSCTQHLYRLMQTYGSSVRCNGCSNLYRRQDVHWVQQWWYEYRVIEARWHNIQHDHGHVTCNSVVHARAKVIPLLSIERSALSTMTMSNWFAKPSEGSTRVWNGRSDVTFTVKFSPSASVHVTEVSSPSSSTSSETLSR